MKYVLILAVLLCSGLPAYAEDNTTPTRSRTVVRKHYQHFYPGCPIRGYKQ